MKIVAKAIKWLGCLIAFFASAIGLYLLAALGGAYVKWSTATHQDAGEKLNTVYLVTGLLHADFAIEATPELINRFPFLKETSLPLENPNLRYLTFGWGSKAFYTTAGSYSDITIAAVTRAVTGDNAVMRVVAFGDISTLEDNIAVRLSDEQLTRLFRFIRSSFSSAGGNEPFHMADVSIGSGDAFYAGRGHFNIFYPCNQWVNEALRHAGVSIGEWTPTTYSLRHSLAYYNVEN